jgi:DNA-directed RNA polymerase specialized sigma24 family protein
VRELPSFWHNRQPGAFRHWLRTTTTNRLQTFLRARQAHVAEAPGLAAGE